MLMRHLIGARIRQGGTEEREVWLLAERKTTVLPYSVLPGLVASCFRIQSDSDSTPPLALSAIQISSFRNAPSIP